jgi:putative peptidoglycan lipid II flippase
VELVRPILAAYAVGIVASSSVKLFASGFHALQDTVTPMRIAVVAVLVGVACGAGLMLAFRGAGLGPRAASGLALGGAMGAWLNLTLLGHGLGRRVGSLLAAPEWKALLRLLTAAAVAGAAGLMARRWIEELVGVDSWLTAAAVLGAVVLAGGIPYLLIARRPPRLVQVGKAP